MNSLQSFKNLLFKAGLEEAEVDFYMTALKNPSVSIHEISRKTKIAKTSAYRVFEQLKERGLLSLSDNGKIEILPLKKFIENFEKQQRALTKLTHSLKESAHLLPFLSQEEDVSIKIFRGDDIKEMYVDLAKFFHWDIIFAFGDFEFFIEELGLADERKFIENRMKTGKHAQGIFVTDDIYSRNFVDQGKKELRKSLINTNIIMPKKWVNVLPSINTTAFFSEDELGMKLVLVKNKDIAESQIALFQNFWTQSDR